MGTFIDPALIPAPDYVIITPCHNASSSISRFLHQLEITLNSLNRRFLLLVVDDASNDDTLSLIRNFQFTNLNIDLQVLSLPYPHGQEGAIAKGLSFANQIKCEHFILMEANGQDDPQAIPELIKASKSDVVFVDKGPKAGNLLFWIIYRFYLTFFHFLTSKEINLGCYSMISRKALQELIRMPFFHYATAIYKKPLKLGKIRYEQKMQGFKQELRSLFQHGIRSFIEFGEDLLSAFLKLSLSLGFLLFVAVLTALYFKWFTDIPLPGWTIFALIGLFNGLLLSIGFFALGVMLLNRIKSPMNKFTHSHEVNSRFRKSETSIPFYEPISLN